MVTGSPPATFLDHSVFDLWSANFDEKLRRLVDWADGPFGALAATLYEENVINSFRAS